MFWRVWQKKYACKWGKSKYYCFKAIVNSSSDKEANREIQKTELIRCPGSEGG